MRFYVGALFGVLSLLGLTAFARMGDAATPGDAVLRESQSEASLSSECHTLLRTPSLFLALANAPFQFRAITTHSILKLGCVAENPNVTFQTAKWFMSNRSVMGRISDYVEQDLSDPARRAAEAWHSISILPMISSNEGLPSSLHSQPWLQGPDSNRHCQAYEARRGTIPPPCYGRRYRSARTLSTPYCTTIVERSANT